MNEILRSKEARNYVRWSKRIGVITDLRLPVDHETQAKYNEALEGYREYLHNHFIPPLYKIYPYDRNDRDTWRYLSINVHCKKYLGDVINPTFKYKDAIHG